MDSSFFLGDTCITQTYNTKINKYLELSVAMRNLWCSEKNSILPLITSATGIVLLGTRKTGQMCHSVVKISKPYLSYS
jgi:hypothetical protein